MELSQNMAEKIIVISSFLMGCSIIIHLGVSMAMESSQITTHDVGPIPATPGGATLRWPHSQLQAIHTGTNLARSGEVDTQYACIDG